ncbi:TMAO reductase system periplasmic protein TorT [Vibrio orientalis CIP 102891 = ATCC 33934]|uniref:Periplasmic protein TorT n=1 Tax=Vibrio orientalis CIP 102891 = ATCC 33934 TaxID=675816 RepID=C9QDV5_VIBOR|nr:TMAO reductase system periplasmic protein TorT [Vibrio orientalis]EEX94095.1 periplasmic protein TorT precursor [Vibrio orientalis CIP 102891 = ATCC 33934]EGU52762.1 TMAO reductase system periplasmic protein TorT [Vibrio orientalis CIP 102891 = ATCC 33934]
MSLISAIKKRATTFSALLLIAFANQAYAQEPLRICGIYPHLKDSYWLSVNYGMVDEAKKQNVDLRVLEAGGYLNLEKQRQHLSLCVRWNADAIILGTVAPDLFYDSLRQYVGSTPVFATVNKFLVDDTNKTNLKGEVGVDWYWMGYYTGEYLRSKHPKGSGIANVSLLPGPKSSGGTKPVIKGFYAAIKDSDINITETLWADNDKELQRNLVQSAIDNPDIDYIVGSAVAIEAAISELRSAGKTDDIGLVSTYLSHGVYRGLLRDRVEFAPTDKMVLQGRLSIQQAVSYLRGEQYEPVMAPIIEPLTPHKLNPKVIEQSLSPSEYRPTFYVYNENK